MVCVYTNLDHVILFTALGFKIHQSLLSKNNYASHIFITCHLKVHFYQRLNDCVCHDYTVPYIQCILSLQSLLIHCCCRMLSFTASSQGMLMSTPRITQATRPCTSAASAETGKSRACCCHVVQMSTARRKMASGTEHLRVIHPILQQQKLV